MDNSRRAVCYDFVKISCLDWIMIQKIVDEKFVDEFQRNNSSFQRIQTLTYFNGFQSAIKNAALFGS